MAWYATGTISVTNGSTSVTGSGTQFITGAQVGEGLLVAGGLYEIQSIISATELTLGKPYLASTQNGVEFEVVPTQSLAAVLASGVSNLITNFQGVVDNAGAGKFSDGTAANPGITFLHDQDNGLFRTGADAWALVSGGVVIANITPSGMTLPGTATMDGLVVGNGGIYLGGTGAAKKLDDYEEGSGSSVVKVGGTVVTQSNSRGYKYVKVGNIVTFYFEFSVGNLNGGTGEASIDLPFTCDEYGIGGVRIYGGAVVGNEFLGVSPSSALCKFKTNVNNSATGNMALTVDGYYYGSVTYIVS